MNRPSPTVTPIDKERIEDMTAYEYLSQAFLLEQQIRSKLAMIDSLKALATFVASRGFSGKPEMYTRNDSAREGTIRKIMEAEKELDAQIDAMVDLKLEIAKTIDQVKDATMRLILEKRYLGYESRKQIAEELKITERWVQSRHAEALKVVQRILDEEKNPRTSP